MSRWRKYLQNLTETFERHVTTLKSGLDHRWGMRMKYVVTIISSREALLGEKCFKHMTMNTERNVIIVALVQPRETFCLYQYYIRVLNISSVPVLGDLSLIKMFSIRQKHKSSLAQSSVEVIFLRKYFAVPCASLFCQHCQLCGIMEKVECTNWNMAFYHSCGCGNKYFIYSHNTIFAYFITFDCLI